METAIGRALKGERDRREMTQREAAAEMSHASGRDVSQANLGRWELGLAVPSAEFYEALARFLGLNKEQLAVVMLETHMDHAGIEISSAASWRARKASRV